MKGFERDNLLFSLCGLNCGLCPMHLDGYCPSCGGGEGNQSCAIARCSLKRGSVAYCFQCPAYPCERYAGIDDYDSFITHFHRIRDMEKAADIGMDAYCAEQREKIRILRQLLNNYNDGRRKRFYCAAVNLLELPDLQQVMTELQQLAERTKENGQPAKEKAAYAAKLLQAAADEKQLSLKLRKKPKTKLSTDQKG